MEAEVEAHPLPPTPEELGGDAISLSAAPTPQPADFAEVPLEEDPPLPPTPEELGSMM